MNPELEAHLRSLVNFPSPPGVATHIIELARDPDIEMGKVAKALSMDSALSIKILRIANSPLYAQRRKSENLRQALVVLGLNATLTLALSFSLVKGPAQRQGQRLESYSFYWRRALLAATAARALADAMRQSLVEEIFLAALLQDVGMLALDKPRMPDLYRGKARRCNAITSRSAEPRRMKRLQVGPCLCRRLADEGPGIFRNVCTSRHQRSVTSSRHGLPVPTARRSSIAASPSRATVADLFLLEPEQRQFAETALQRRTQSWASIKWPFGQVLGTIGSMIPDTEAIFEADLLAKQHPELILEQARDVLMLRSLHALREINTLRSVGRGQLDHARASKSRRRRAATRSPAPTTALILISFWRASSTTATSHKWPLSVAFADLDKFKTFNDSFGHQAGDRILQATARILRGNTRETDMIARYGGEEFVVVLPATDAETARSICERIVACVSQAPRHVIGSEQTRR